MSLITEDPEAYINFYVRMPRHFGQKEMMVFGNDLSGRVEAAVSNDCFTGKYKPDAEGLYEVRLFVNKLLSHALTKTIIEINHGQIVRTEYVSIHGKEVTTK